MNRLALFDLDGTLVRTEDVVEESFLAFRRERGLPMGRVIGGRPFPQVVAEINDDARAADPAHRDWSTDEVNAVTGKRQREEFAKLRAAGKGLTDGCAALLRLLAAEGYALGIVTNSTRRRTERILEDAGLAADADTKRPVFAHVVCPDDGHGAKPSAAPFLKVMADAGAQASACLMFGDDFPDFDGATAAGVARQFARVHAHNLGKSEEFARRGVKCVRDWSEVGLSDFSDEFGI